LLLPRLSEESDTPVTRRFGLMLSELWPYYRIRKTPANSNQVRTAGDSAPVSLPLWPGFPFTSFGCDLFGNQQVVNFRCRPVSQKSWTDIWHYGNNFSVQAIKQELELFLHSVFIYIQAMDFIFHIAL